MNATEISHEVHFSCRTCKVKFNDLTLFKSHYRSEWHSYNLHASVNRLLPITLEDFQAKEAIYRKSSADQVERKKQICEICRKNFNGMKQYENHLISKTHKKNLQQNDNIVTRTKKLPDRFNCRRNDQVENVSVENGEEMEICSDVESLDSDEWLEDSKYRIDNNCLFCNYQNESIEGCMKHMKQKHSFFVPDLEYCVDLSGLLEYLEQKICADFKCIWCNDSGRKMRSAQAVKMHMVDKGHCKMLFEGDTMLEYSSFYDYSSSYPDVENANPDEELPELPNVLDDEGYVMKLPSGKSIVHRSLALYYKQNLPMGTTVTIKNFNHWLHKRMFKSISFGTAERKLEAARMTTRDVQTFQRVQAKQSVQLQIKQNKLQNYMRRQTGF